MRILILNQSFHPDVVAVAQHATDLAAALAAAGHSVTVIASRDAYTDPSIRFPAREELFGCSVRRLPTLCLGKRRPWRRVADIVVLLAQYALELARLPRFDVVLAMTHPPMVAFVASLATRLKGGRLVSWIMDLNPDEAIAAGYLRSGSLTAVLLNRALRFALRSSSGVVVLDPFMLRRIQAKGVPASRIHIIPPWSHDGVVRYHPAGREELRKAWGLTGKFVVMYSGNLSPVHPLDTILEAARRLRDRDDIAFCFVGAGNALPLVKAFTAEHDLKNIVTLGYQPLNRIAGSLSVADLHLVVMGDAMAGIVHPCKIYNILTLGIPFLYVGPPSSHISDIAGSLGPPGGSYSRRHGDAEGVATAILDAADRRLGSLPEWVRVSRQFSGTLLIDKLVKLLEEVNLPGAEASQAAVPSPGKRHRDATAPPPICPPRPSASI